MVRFFGRKTVWVYGVLVLAIALGYARYNPYAMDGDGTAFLDISQAMTDGHPGLAINGYWNPAYPAVLAEGRVIAHASTWNELAAARMTNVFVFALTMIACLFFTSGLVRLRAQRDVGEAGSALPSGALHLLGLALLLLSAGRELPLEAVRADAMLLALFLVAAGLVLRLQTGAGFWAYPVLGLTLGCAYLTKSFGFLPSVFLIVGMLVFGLTRKGAERIRIASGAAVAAVVFAGTAGPYVAAISRQLGHLTTGDSARINYSFFVDQTPRWHEDYTHDFGHALGKFTHPEQVLATDPPVFSFAQHPVGTFPLWFDPAYWTSGLKPHIWLKGHAERLVRCSELFVRFLLNRPEVFVLLAVMLFFGAVWPRWREMRVWTPPVVWGLLMLAIYFPVDLQDRYLTGPFLLVMLPLFAWLRRRREANDRQQSIASALVLLLAGIVLMQGVMVLAEERRQLPPELRGRPGYSPEITQAAIGLAALGVRPGDKLACYGDIACYTDHYWARIPGAQILAEVQTPNSNNTQTEWNAIPNKNAVIAPLKAMGLRYIVTKFPNSAQKPAGWVQLGTSDFFAYPLIKQQH